MASSSSAPASSAPNFPTPLVPPGAPRMPTARLQPAFQPGMGRLPSTAHAGQTMPSLCRLSRAQHVPRAAVVDQVRENEWRRDALKRKRQEEADKSEAYWRAHPPAPAAEFSVSSLSLNALREPRIMIGTSDNQALAVSLDKIKHIRVLHVMLAQFEYPDLDHFATMEEMMDIIKAALESSPDKVLPRKVNGQQVLAPVPFPARVMNRVFEFCSFHEKPPVIYDDAYEPPKKVKFEKVDEWDKKFFESFESKDDVCLLASVAHFLEIRILEDRALGHIAKLMKGKTPEQIRQTFGITPDFTQREYARVKRACDWARPSPTWDEQFKQIYKKRQEIKVQKAKIEAQKAKLAAQANKKRKIDQVGIPPAEPGPKKKHRKRKGKEPVNPNVVDRVTTVHCGAAGFPVTANYNSGRPRLNREDFIFPSRV